VFKPYLELPRTVHVLCLGTLVNRAGTFLVPFLTLYLTTSLDLGAPFATRAMGVYGFGGLLAAIVGGQLADRVGRRRVMLTSLLGASGILLVFGRITSPPALLVAVFAFAFLGEMYRPAASAMIADLTPPAQRPAAFGLMYVTVNLGMAISPIVGGLIAEHSYQYLFWGDAFTSTAYAVLLATAVRETLPARATGADGRAAPHLPVGTVLRRVLAHRSFLLFCLATHLVSIVYMQSHSTLPLHLNALGFGPRDYGRIVAVNAFLIVCLQLPFTTWLARFPREVMLAIGAAITAVGFGLTGFATTLWPLVGTVVVWTVGEMVQSAYLSPVVSDMAPRDLRATYMGMLTLSFASALMVGAPLGGMVQARWGPAGLWGGAFALALTGAAVYAALGSAIRRAHEAARASPH
jgi:MFS family permease